MSIENIQYQESSQNLTGKSLEKISKSAFALMPKVANDSSTITEDSLPNMYCQYYDSGSERRMFFNINGSISSINVDDIGLKIDGQTSGDILYYNGTSWSVLPSGTTSQYLRGGSTMAWTDLPTHPYSNVAFTYALSPIQAVSTDEGTGTLTQLTWYGASVTSSYTDVIFGKFKKLSDVSKLDFYAYLKQTGGGSTVAYCRCKIGTASNVASSGAGAYTWASATVALSGLTTGSTYDLTIGLASDDGGGIAGGAAYLGSAVGIVY